MMGRIGEHAFELFTFGTHERTFQHDDQRGLECLCGGHHLSLPQVAPNLRQLLPRPRQFSRHLSPVASSPAFVADGVRL